MSKLSNMDKEEEVLTILAEECAEVIVAISKIRRFGPENYKMLAEEIGDLLCILELTRQFAPDIYKYNLEQFKVKKLQKLKIYSDLFGV